MIEKRIGIKKLKSKNYFDTNEHTLRKMMDIMIIIISSSIHRISLSPKNKTKSTLKEGDEIKI